MIYSSLEIEELQQGAQQVVLRRPWLCLCGQLTGFNGEEDIEIAVRPSGQSLKMLWGPSL